MAQTFQQVLQRLIDEKQNGLGSVNALAKRFTELYGGKRDDYRKQIKRHLGSGGRVVEPEEPTIVKYAEAFAVKRSVFPAAVSLRQARGREVNRVHELLTTAEEIAPQLKDLLAEIRSLLPDPPANPGRPTKRRPQKQ